MKVYKALFCITLIAGLTILLIGVELKFSNQSSEGLTAGRLGNIHHGMITGYIGIFRGILILLLSNGTYRIYKVEKQKFEKWDKRQMPTRGIKNCRFSRLFRGCSSL